MLPGHVLIDQGGAILEADEAFGRLLQTDPDTLKGRDVISLTAPADREECAQAVRDLIETRQSFDIVKRFLRDDGTVVWARNSVSLMTVNAVDLVVATCAPVSRPVLHRSPSMLLHAARAQVEMMRDREQVLDATVLSVVSWQSLLHIYIAEAEGRLVDIAALAGVGGQSVAVVRRWVAVLVGKGMLEVETRDLDPDAPKAYRLTAAAMRRLEEHLAKFAPGANRPPATGGG